MIKKNWKVLLITSIVILLPVLAGIVLWEQLPQQLPIHWNPEWQVDGWAGKGVVVLGMPLLLLAIHWLCVLGTAADPKHRQDPGKVLQLVFWITPLVCVAIFAITYATAMGKAVRVERVVPVFIGFVFAVIGNYMPKCKQSYTIGIKIPWTLNSQENWNKTHRFAGWLWMLCGIIFMAAGFFGCFDVWVFLTVTVVMVIAPMVYSYALYRKGI